MTLRFLGERDAAHGTRAECEPAWTSLRQRWNGWIERLLVEVRRASSDDDVARRGHLAIIFGIATLFAGTSLGVANLLRGIPALGLITIGFAVLSALVPGWLVARNRVLLAGNSLALFWVVVTALTAYVRGGVASGAFVAMAGVPVMAVVLVGRRSGFAWFGVVIATIVGFYTFASLGVALEDRVPPASRALVTTIAACALSGALLCLTVAQQSLKSAALADYLRSERDSRALIQGLPDRVLHLDRRGRVLGYHDGKAAAFGAEDLHGRIGKPLAEVLPDHAPSIAAAVGEATATATARTCDYELQEGGRTRSFEARVSPGSDAGVVVIIRDTTALRRAQGAALDAEAARALAQSEAQMLRTERIAEIGQLAAGVAHEINNPLTYVLANLDYIARKLEGVPAFGADDRLRTALQDATYGAARVRDIVRDLRTFVRDPQSEPVTTFALESVAETSIRIVENEIRHRATLRRDYHPAPAVTANESRVSQLFVNLLTNAAHALDESRGPDNEVVVWIGTAADGNAAFEVRDTGSGIAPEHLARITEPFFTTKGVGFGTGLGLSVCKNIVDQLGGSLTIGSALGQGTTVRISLPAGAQAPEVAVERAAARPQPTSARVLICDDDPHVLKAMRLYLDEFYDCVTASSGAEAIERLRREAGGDYDVFLCDLMMPHMSGMDVYEHVAREWPGLARRMVFTTGGAFTRGARAFVEDGVHPVLAKPFTPEQAVALIEAARRR